jgi:hypothetical protein
MKRYFKATWPSQSDHFEPSVTSYFVEMMKENRWRF